MKRAGSARGSGARHRAPVRYRSVRLAVALAVGRRNGGLDAAQEVERGGQRLVVLRVLRDVGLRAGLLGALALALEVAAQLRLAGHLAAALLVVRHVLQHLDVGRDALGLDRAAGRRVVARGGEPQGAVVAAERNDGLHRALAERARAEDGGTLLILQRAGDDLGRGGRAAVD